ncbi:uncharacterized protein LOC142569635 [Dermacentor variabilis]|uniref:uncharacterized protein LOC142569635 n=1 Tax=Dermacentor variabilis TaxID=34621 RepID=UPI003F5B97D2
MPRLRTRMQRRLATDFAPLLNKTAAAAAFRDQRHGPDTATLGLNALVGGRNAAGIPGPFLPAAASCRRSIGPETLARASWSTEQSTARIRREGASRVMPVVDRQTQRPRCFSLPLQQPRRWFTEGGSSSQVAQRVLPDLYTGPGFWKPPPTA